MNQLDRIPKEIIKYWKSFETEDSSLQVAKANTVNNYDTFIFIIGLKDRFHPIRVLAFADTSTVIYYWNHELLSKKEQKQLSENEFLRILKLKAFI